MNIITVQGYHSTVNAPNLVCVNGLIQALAEIPNVTVTVAGDVMHEEFPDIDWKRHPAFALKRIVKWPSINPDGAVACYRNVKEKVQGSDYDVMIAFHCPYEAVDAAVRVKKEHPSIKLVLFEIDPITNDINTSIGIGKRLNILREGAESRTFRYADLIVHMEGNRKHFMSKKYERYHKKTIFLDLPLIADNVEHRNWPCPMGIDDEAKSKGYRLIFSGRLSSLYRSPEYLIKVLCRVNQQIPLSVDFYSKGDCEETLRRHSQENSFIHPHGYISPVALEIELHNSDFLVNIGNQMSDMVPSKLFGYFLTGKPVIHISSQSEDVCLNYLEKYGLFINLNDTDDVEQSAQKLVNFMKASKGKFVNQETVRRQFEHNTFSWNAQQLVKALNTV